MSERNKRIIDVYLPPTDRQTSVERLESKIGGLAKTIYKDDDDHYRISKDGNDLVFSRIDEITRIKLV